MADLSEHFQILDTVAAALEAIDEKAVFVGGMIAGLLITDQLATGIRPTDDVDFIVEVAGYSDYQKLLKKLEKGGFSHDMKHPSPLCRMTLGSIAVDVLPTKEDVLSFSNAWYPLAVETAISFKLPNDRVIQIVNAPLFLCTKIDAFSDRGKGNYMTSTDLEDIVAILNGRKELWQEVWSSPSEAREYLRKSFADFSC